jgi:hypothetical protein
MQVPVRRDGADPSLRLVQHGHQVPAPAGLNTTQRTHTRAGVATEIAGMISNKSIIYRHARFVEASDRQVHYIDGEGVERIAHLLCLHNPDIALTRQ